MNTKRKRLLEQLAAYFIQCGGVLTESEYKARKDVPIRYFFIKRYIGNWAKTMQLLKKNFPEVYEVVQKPLPKETATAKKVVENKKEPAKAELKEGKKDEK